MSSFEDFDHPTFCLQHLTEREKDMYFNLAIKCRFFDYEAFIKETRYYSNDEIEELFNARKQSIIGNICLMILDMYECNTFREYLERYSPADLTNQRRVDPFWCLWCHVREYTSECELYSDEEEFL
jgi:hypothetical protein